MSVLVGFAPEARGRGGLELAALLARSGSLPLTVCCVVPDRWEAPSKARVDADYADYLRDLAGQALDEARLVLAETPTTGPVDYVVRTGRSVPAALLAEAAERDATLLVAGSSTDGSWGHVVLGSVTGRLLHSSDRPLALAPRGYRAGSVAAVDRVTVAVDGTAGSLAAVLEAGRTAHRLSARLRLLTFAVRGRTMYPPEVGLDAEATVMAAWQEQAEGYLADAAARLTAEGDCAGPEESAVVGGRGWADALSRPEWTAADVLVLGSSRQGPIARVFLGSTAAHIVRHSPVPVVVLPAT